MAAQTTKSKDSTTVRIWTEPKKRLQKVVRRKADKEDREVTEVELVSEAINQFCQKEEKKLGI